MRNKNIMKNGEIDLIILINFFLERKFIIVLFAVLSAGVSIAISFQIPKEFKVISQFVYKSNNESSNLKFAPLASLAGINVNKGTDMSLYLKEIISSNDFLLNIANRDWKFNKSDDKKVNFSELWDIKKDMTIDNSIAMRKINISILKVLREKIVYNKDSKSSVISIITTFESPFLSYSINKYIVNQLRNYIKNNINSKAKRDRIFIEKKLHEVKQELTDSENKFIKFNNKNVIVSSPSQKIQNSRLMRDIKIKEAIYLDLEKQFELSVIKENNSAPIFEIISQPLMPVEKSKPQRKLIVLLGTIAGTSFGMFIILLFDWYRVNKNSIE